MKNNLQLININYSNSLKGLAILIITIGHIGIQFSRIATPLGGIGVFIFLFLSAYGLEKSYNIHGLNGFILKRIKTVWIPYIFLEILFFYFNRGNSLVDYFLDLTMIKPLFQLGWYLNYLVVWYIIYYIIKKIESKYEIWIFFGIAFLFSIIFYKYSSIRFEQSFSFVFGILISKYENYFKRFINYKYFFILTIISIILLFLKQTSFFRIQNIWTLNFLNLFIKSLFAIGIIIFWFYVCDSNFYNKHFNTIFILLGKYSYSLYLIQGYTLLLYKAYDKIVSTILFLIITPLLTFLFQRIISIFQKKN